MKIGIPRALFYYNYFPCLPVKLLMGHVKKLFGVPNLVLNEFYGEKKELLINSYNKHIFR